MRKFVGLIILAAICHLCITEPAPEADSCCFGNESCDNSGNRQRCPAKQRCYVAKYASNDNLARGCISPDSEILKKARIQSSALDKCSHVASTGIKDRSPFGAICLCNTNDCNTKVLYLKMPV